MIRMPPALFEAMLAQHGNAFMVGACDGHTIVNAPATFLLVPGLKRPEAANLAAWIIMVADLVPGEINPVLVANGWAPLKPARRSGPPEKGDAVEVFVASCCAHVVMGQPGWQLRRVLSTTDEGFHFEGDEGLLIWGQEGVLWRWPT